MGLHISLRFRETSSFPRAWIEENCELRGTVNVQGQISKHTCIFTLNAHTVLKILLGKCQPKLRSAFPES